MNNDTQIMKGLLEGCILRLIGNGEVYGYQAVEMLNAAGFDVNEATVYPILVRLQNKGLLSTEQRMSPLGPPRKYYRMTAQGMEDLVDFTGTWKKTKSIVERILEEGGWSK